MAVNFGCNVPIRAVVLGGRGGIGGAFVSLLQKLPNTAFVGCTSRDEKWVADFNRKEADDGVRARAFPLDMTNEDSFVEFVDKVKNDLSLLNGAPDGERLNLVINASGFLHNTDISPETSLRKISKMNFTENFSANTLSNFLAARYIMGDRDLLQVSTDTRNAGVFATLSARVGSVTHNELGGWYSYRASKAATNMLVKTAAIEAKRILPNWRIIALHPGTVQSPLSAPFTRFRKRNLITTEKDLHSGPDCSLEDFGPENALFWTPELCCESLWTNVIQKATVEQHSGKLLDYACREISP